MADGGRGGDGGNGNGGDAYAGAGTGGDGGRGGDGGTASANAGSFDMSNAMNGSSNAAAGIMMVAQNIGASSLIHLVVTFHAYLNVLGPYATFGASRSSPAPFRVVVVPRSFRLAPSAFLSGFSLPPLLSCDPVCSPCFLSLI